MLDEIGIAPVRERASGAIDQADRPVGVGEQQRAAVGRDLATVERSNDRAPLDASKIQRIRCTV